MTDAHAQLETWLAEGAPGDPPREIAVHASLCERCTAALGAFDGLALIDVAAARRPPPLAAPSRLRVGMAWARVGTAVTAALLAGILVVFGISQLVGLGGPAGAPAAEPEGTQLAGLGNPSDGEAVPSHQPSGGDSTPAEAPSPLGSETPLPGFTPGPLPSLIPGATPRPPTPGPSAPGPTPTPSPMPTETPAATAVPTETATPTPSPPEPTPTPTASP